MSTVPSGYQAPKTNWQGSDVVLPSDFNRIEGNIQAIETGNRTLDQTQVPTSNTGSLRQLLDWFANRIKAITGAANWYDAPPMTLAGAKSHAENTNNPHGVTAEQVGAPTTQDFNNHLNDGAAHGATSAATANAIIRRDSAGRAKVAAPSEADDIATKGYVDQKADAAVAAHANRTDNPHNVQAQQVPYSSGVTGFTPTEVKAALDALAGVRIVEMSDNDNGTYVRWENGLQVCWHVIREFRRTTRVTGALYRDDVDTLWTFPAAFIDPPRVYGTVLRPQDDDFRFFLTPTFVPAEWAVGYRDVCTESSASTIDLLREDHLLAIGMWK